MLRLISRQYVRPIGRVSRTEQLLGIGILALTFGVVAAFVAQVLSLKEASSWNAADAYATASAGPLDSQVAITAHVPAELPNPWTTVALDGWTAPQRALRYTRENLYIKINGQAPAYLKAGFVSLTFANYAHESDSQRTISVFCYEMSNAVNATAVYKAEAPPDIETIPIGDEAYEAGGAVFFRKDRFYTQLLPAQTREPDGRAARRLAQLLDSWLDAHTSVPAPPPPIPESPVREKRDHE